MPFDGAESQWTPPENLPEKPGPEAARDRAMITAVVVVAMTAFGLPISVGALIDIAYFFSGGG